MKTKLAALVAALMILGGIAQAHGAFDAITSQFNKDGNNVLRGTAGANPNGNVHDRYTIEVDLQRSPSGNDGTWNSILRGTTSASRGGNAWTTPVTFTCTGATGQKWFRMRVLARAFDADGFFAHGDLDFSAKQSISNTRCANAPDNVNDL